MDLNLIASEDITEIEDITKCINNILSIPAGSIPLARDLGIKWTNLSKIPPDLENDIATEIIGKVAAYEPRVSVSEVTFSYSDTGKVIVNIAVERGRNYGGR